jgi:hypothetical protein
MISIEKGTKAAKDKKMNKTLSFSAAISSRILYDDYTETETSADVSNESAVLRKDRKVSSLQSTSLLAERVSVIESITWLGRHVPRCVIRDISREVLRIDQKEDSFLVMPYVQTYRAALLFIDMSGFTKLSLLLDLESLSKVRAIHSIDYSIFVLLIFVVNLYFYRLTFIHQKLLPPYHLPYKTPDQLINSSSTHIFKKS